MYNTFLVFETTLCRLFLLNGVHDEKKRYDLHYFQYVNINLPISIIGESREHCVVMGGLQRKGNEEDDVNVSNVTLRESKRYGVYGYRGVSVHLEFATILFQT